MGLLTSKEAARRVGVKEGTLRTWRWKGINLEYLVIGTRSIRYDAGEIAEFIRKGLKEVGNGKDRS